MSLEIVILAAGQGTRMRSALPKVLHPVAGNSMLGHVIHSARQLDPQRIHVVIGHGADVVRERLAADDLNFVLQDKQLGTGHATAQAVPFIKADTVLILYGDVPLIEVETLQRLLKHVVPGQMGLLTVELDDPTGYGRIVRDADGKVAAIVEHKDASGALRAITEGNTGILAVPANRLADWMSRLSNNNAQGEYYLTDVIEMAVSDGLLVATEQPHDPMEVQGANDRKQLAELERHYQLREGRRLMAQGVTLRDPARFDVRGDVTVGRDVLIDINVILEGRVIIEGDAVIGARTNVGAGTITCNYDGANKHQTVLGEDVFIGSNNSLVAPVKVGDGATTAAGSTINQDVDNLQLGVARARQRNIDGWKRPVKIKKN